MGKTIVEKIFSEHSGKDVSAGDYAVVNLDFMYMPDTSSPLTIDLLADRVYVRSLRACAPDGDGQLAQKSS